jgi:hypothetical protein
MRKIICLAAVAATFAIFDTDAHAAFPRDRANGIMLTACPAGTCSPRGRPRARDIKLCSAANCNKK